MSYDITIGKFDANYTSNLAPLMHRHIKGDGDETGLQVLHGKCGGEALVILDMAFDSLNHEYCRIDNVAKFREQYDATNGWGSTDGALIFLARIMAACARFPHSKVDVSA